MKQENLIRSYYTCFGCRTTKFKLFKRVDGKLFCSQSCLRYYRNCLREEKEERKRKD